MKAIQEIAHGANLGNLKSQPPFQARVTREQLNILRTLASDGLEQDQGFDILGIRATALALFEFEIGGDEVWDFKRTQSA
jgi:hypothetical protein